MRHVKATREVEDGILVAGCWFQAELSLTVEAVPVPGHLIHRLGQPPALQILKQRGYRIEPSWFASYELALRQRRQFTKDLRARA